MSKREDIFSKLNIKDYNNQLETILENKSFSEGTKNILLNILYKIETSYDDYAKVKVYESTKNDFLEETIRIVEKNCDEIEIIRPKINEKTILLDKNYIIEKDKNKIISYPNEKNVFYALNYLNSNRFILNKQYTILKEPLEELLNQGYIIDRDEIIRDFDGWTWNIIPFEIDDFTSNLVYQNLRILVGNNFLRSFLKNNESKDFIIEFEKKLIEVSDKDKKNDFAKLLYQVCILIYIKNNRNMKKSLLDAKKEIEKELLEMEKNKEAIQRKYKTKQKIETELNLIDEKLNNNELLREKFIEENKDLPDNKKIFSLSQYVEILQDKREELLKKHEKYKFVMSPDEFAKKKDVFSKEFETLKSINFGNNTDKEINRLMIELQKSFFKVFNRRIKKIETKKEIIECIYLLRYYKLIYFNRENQIKDIKELEEDIRKTEKFLITKACKLKALNILFIDIEENYKLMSILLSYNIIELEDMTLEFKKETESVSITIYDDETIEDTINYKTKEPLKVKYKKRIKLFN